ncbi:MAG: Calx-beta domain-containing protein [Gemmataceae bacterium]
MQVGKPKDPSIMKTLRTRSRKPAAPAHALRRRLEALEDRTVPSATITVANSTMTEIGSPSAFVSAGSGGLDMPQAIALGPDGNVYVTCNNGAVRRYNGSTGAYISTFVAQGSGGLSGTTVFGLAFGPDGNLYVASPATSQVLEYNGGTGAFIRAFVAAGSGGLNTPSGVTFGPDGNLYVSSRNTNAVLRYQGPLAASPGSPLPASGQSGATFVSPFSGGLTQPLLSAFGPDGNFYVGGGQTSGLLRFDANTGAFLNTFVPYIQAIALAFDQEGRLYVRGELNSIQRFDAQGNSLGDVLEEAVSPTLRGQRGLAFDAQGALLIANYNLDTVVRYDSGVVVSLDSASATPVSVSYTTADGTASAASKYYAQSGTVTFNPGQTSRRILLATKDNLSAEPSESFSVQLSNPTGGATIGTGTAAVTVTDDDTTRQFSVADTTAVEGDHTAHYRGAFIQNTPGRNTNYHVTFGPDGDFYTVHTGRNAIGRYNGTTGAFMDDFVPPDGHFKGSLLQGIAFRAGYLYVFSGLTNEVVRYDATTGAFVDVFVAAGSGGVNGVFDMAFGPDANQDGIPELYVSSPSNNSVLRYDGATGQPLGTYIAAGSGGLSGPTGLTFDSTNTYLYVASNGSNQVLKYNAASGAFVGVAASAGLSAPVAVGFGPDGLLYVASQGNSRIVRYSAGGTYVDDFVPAGSGGMNGPSWMTFGPDGDVYVGHNGSDILRFGTESEAVFTVTNTTPSTLPVTVNYATADGTAVAGSDYAATTGTVTFAPGYTAAMIRVPLLNDATAEGSETFTVNLSSPVGAAIADGTAVGTITDEDGPTKFFVVNDGSPDQTYRYAATGTALGSSDLASGDTAPRGAASTAAGNTVWVVDANRTVYVYNTGGVLLGSWTPGGLNPNAQLEGIATNGTDIWLLDNFSDKVYRYTGAASLLSGSQNAASSFSLVGGKSGNINPKGIVTDGTSFWVVNDGPSTDKTRDRVYKYTLAGATLGSWSIDAGNASPTGLTIDPTNVSNIWIVDNVSLKVYQYTGAATRTSGSQSASAKFALAAGNTNPQDIADPPAPGMLLPPMSVAKSTVALTWRPRQPTGYRSSPASHSCRMSRAQPAAWPASRSGRRTRCGWTRPWPTPGRRCRGRVHEGLVESGGSARGSRSWRTIQS